jgi:glutathione S-transferase
MSPSDLFVGKIGDWILSRGIERHALLHTSVHHNKNPQRLRQSPLRADFQRNIPNSPLCEAEWLQLFGRAVWMGIDRKTIVDCIVAAFSQNNG